MRNSFLGCSKANILLMLVVTPLAHPALAQNIADNIRPVGSVCLEGQACVGTTPGPIAKSNAAGELTETIPARAEGPTGNGVPATSTEVAAETADFDAEGAYQMSCNACHGTGAAGAPMLGDADAWGARMGKGVDALMSNVINGIGAMPARGICMTCSDDDLQAIVDYMLAQN